MALDQTREQLNAQEKRDGGAVGLIDQQGATVLKRWMVAGPLHFFFQAVKADYFVFLAFSLELLDRFGPDFDRIMREV